MRSEEKNTLQVGFFFYITCICTVVCHLCTKFDKLTKTLSKEVQEKLW